jgi:hypothetical protein
VLSITAETPTPEAVATFKKFVLFRNTVIVGEKAQKVKDFSLQPAGQTGTDSDWVLLVGDHSDMLSIRF